MYWENWEKIPFALLIWNGVLQDKFAVQKQWVSFSSFNVFVHDFSVSPDGRQAMNTPLGWAFRLKKSYAKETARTWCSNFLKFWPFNHFNSKPIWRYYYNLWVIGCHYRTFQDFCAKESTKWLTKSNAKSRRIVFCVKFWECLIHIYFNFPFSFHLFFVVQKSLFWLPFAKGRFVYKIFLKTKRMSVILAFIWNWSYQRGRLKQEVI